MCGIAGYIGRSKHPEATFELLTALFRNVEIRGDDASGYWGTEVGANGRILYHKEPVKSTEFVKKAVWTQIANVDTNLMMVHARGASQGSGHPYTNKNNHPFVTPDRSVGLIHNGRIPELEYDALKKKYEVKSDCDSEILLRIFEATEKSGNGQEDYDDPAEWNLASRLRGLKNIWSQITKGHMTVGIGERLEGGNRRLWMFRNKFRPLWFIDLRKYLGQIFFCSTPEIWQSAAGSCRTVRPFIRKRIKLIELPTEQIWVMRVSDEQPVVDDSLIRKYNVLTGNFSTFSYNGEPIPIPPKDPEVDIISRLDGNDVVRYNVDHDFFSKKNETISIRGADDPEAFKDPGPEPEDVDREPPSENDIPLSFDTLSEFEPIELPIIEDGEQFIGPVVSGDSSVSRLVAASMKIQGDAAVSALLDPSKMVPPPMRRLQTRTMGVNENLATASARAAVMADPAVIERSRHAVVQILSESIGDEDVPEDDDEQEREEYESHNIFVQKDTLAEAEAKASDMKMSDISEACDRIKELVEQLETTAWNKHMEGSLAKGKYDSLMESLESTENELKGTAQILDSYA